MTSTIETMEIKTIELKVTSGLLTGSGPCSHEGKEEPTELSHLQVCLMVCEMKRPD